MNVPDEMVEAVMAPMFRALDDMAMRDRDVAAMVIDIVLAAAPTVDYVWCEYQMQPHQHGLIGCPGPDRILLLGPEVEA